MSETDPAILSAILQAAGPPAPIIDFGAWKRVWQKIVPGWATPIDRALAGGLAADRPAWAFAAGYQAAIQQLLPDLPSATIAAVCISEEHGAHPAGIRTRLTAAGAKTGWRLDGTKTFVSGAEGADLLLVAASTGTTTGGRNRLRMVSVPADGAGVRITPLPDLGFVPEMPHGKVDFEAVDLADDALLSGDGYIRAVKPFRTLEDIHVTAAFLAWIFRIAGRFGWPADVREALLVMMAAVHVLAMAPPLAPHVHLALGGLLKQFGRLLEDIEPLWGVTEASIQRRWRRDSPILTVAAAARRRRLETARRICFSS